MSIQGSWWPGLTVVKTPIISVAVLEGLGCSCKQLWKRMLKPCLTSHSC